MSKSATITETALTNMILREASRFIGLREIRPNARWDNPATPGIDTALCLELREMMRPAPWQEGWAYCAAFCEGVVVSALRRTGATDEQIRRFSRTMNAHVLSSFNGFNALKLTTMEPTPGAIWFAQHGSTTSGHAGFVTSRAGVRMGTIEANTSLDPSSPSREREGDWITTRLRHTNNNGRLTTRGFLPVANLIKLIG
jgi:hypothetical protein